MILYGLRNLFLREAYMIKADLPRGVSTPGCWVHPFPGSGSGGGRNRRRIAEVHCGAGSAELGGADSGPPVRPVVSSGVGSCQFMDRQVLSHSGMRVA